MESDYQIIWISQGRKRRGCVKTISYRCPKNEEIVRKTWR